MRNISSPTSAGGEERPRSQDPNERIAEYTLWLERFTGILAFVGVAQAFLIGGQIYLARQEFIATHRPRIRVRFLQENSESPDGRRTAYLTIANVGDTEAIITRIGGDIGIRHRSDRRWMAPGIRGSASGGTPPPNNIVKGGEQRTYMLTSLDPLPYANVPEVMRDADLMALGEIIYRDRNGVIRHTSYLWYWETNSSDWLPAQDPQNFED